MGSFTELVLSCELKRDDSSAIARDLALWCGEIDLDREQAGPWFYETFKYENFTRFPGRRNYSLTNCLDDDSLCFSIRANRKNLAGEIHDFLVWLAPYSATEGFVGYMRHELEEDPRLIFFSNGKAFLKTITGTDEMEIVPTRKGIGRL